MKRLAAWVLAVTILTIPFLLRVLTDGAGGLAYVYSESMEPTLTIGTGFVLIPATDLQVGDVITFYPVKLEADRVTHRILRATPQGFITLGDNNADTDQAAGEPPVSRERIIGKAWTYNGAIVKIPYLGPISQTLRDLLGKHLSKLIGLLVGAGTILFLYDLVNRSRNRPSRMRWRVGHLYGLAASGAVVVLAISLLLGSRVHSIDYLVSQNPGEVPNHVAVGQPGTVRLTAANMGLVRVLHFSEGVGAVTVIRSPEEIVARSSEVVELGTPPHEQTGWYRAYVRVYHFPPLLPRAAVAWLFAFSPDLAKVGLVAALAAALGLVVPFINTWAPLKARGGPSWGILFRRLSKMPPPRRRKF